MHRALLFVLVVTACGLTPDATAVTGFSTTTPPTIFRGPVVTTTIPIGDERRPVVVLLAAPGEADADALAASLEGAGPAVRVETVDPAEAIEQMCSNPATTIVLLPAVALPLAEQQCGAQVALAAVKSGLTASRTEFIIRRSETITDVSGLAGKTWAFSSERSLSGFTIPSGILAAANIAPGAAGPVGSQAAVIEAVYDSAAFFGTVLFFPAVDGNGETSWNGDPTQADVASALLKDCSFLKEEKMLRCGDDLFPKDARTLVAAEHPDVVEKIKILSVSDAVHHDGVVLGPQLPVETATALSEALVAAAETGVFEGYNWDGLAIGTTEELQALRSLVSSLGLTLANV